MTAEPFLLEEPHAEPFQDERAVDQGNIHFQQCMVEILVQGVIEVRGGLINLHGPAPKDRRTRQPCSRYPTNRRKRLLRKRRQPFRNHGSPHIAKRT